MKDTDFITMRLIDKHNTQVNTTHTHTHTSYAESTSPHAGIAGQICLICYQQPVIRELLKEHEKLLNLMVKLLSN